MQLHFIDISIIVAYIGVTIIIGLWISKKASKNLDSYFLGSKSLPWYMLGISNASGMFDITGTMWLVYLAFVYGLKSVWIPWLWPMFNQIFLMIYLAIWLRRSNVLTGAEWIKTRFGTGRSGNLAHLSVVFFALVGVVGNIAYGFKGIGRFAAIFFPWDLTTAWFSSNDMYAIIFMSVTTLYVVKGGMFSVVFTEILQFSIMTIASIAIGIIAMLKVSPEMLAKFIPESWTNIFFGWTLDLDWTGIMNSVNTRIAEDGYSLFTIFLMMILFKGILISAAGPAPNYDMQRVLATRNPKEAGMMSGFVNVALFFPRYMMIMGLTVLALAFFSSELNAMGEGIDFELILPYAIKNFVPVGLMGIVIAGLISAFMSTFAATVNSAPAYFVNDIYKRFINPKASDKKYVGLSRLVSAVFVVVGMITGMFAENINQVTLWIVAAFYGGYAAANVLKWYWWRFNGYGYFWGLLSGTLAAMIAPLLLPEWRTLDIFPVILVVSVLGCILGTLFTKPESDDVLMTFYKQVRPWGFWKPVLQKVLVENPDFQANKNFKRDMVNVVIGIIWQLSLSVLPMYLIIKEMLPTGLTLFIIIVCSILLKKNWYDKLEED